MSPGVTVGETTTTLITLTGDGLPLKQEASGRHRHGGRWTVVRHRQLWEIAARTNGAIGGRRWGLSHIWMLGSLATPPALEAGELAGSNPAIQTHSPVV